MKTGSKDKVRQQTIRKNNVKIGNPLRITRTTGNVNYLNLSRLNDIFNQNFTDGHLLVYIDGKLVFNGTTTDDLSLIIYNLINLISGNHEIKVVFTDDNGNTSNYTENLTV